MECKKGSNAERCPCLHTECSHHGACCECLQYHLGLEQLPACCFPEDTARTDERSIRKFVELHS
ncbi:cytosolic protein [Candidatus Woesearchaeota archaeon]|nr:cytosolic protein [Candidatus Woesearchaeota archaeon]